MSPFKRFLRRIPAMRYCALQYALRERKRQREVRWEHVKSVLVTVGNMTIMWAGVERVLDELIAFYQHHGTALEAEHPRSLSSKLKYLRVMQRDERFTPEIREFLRVTRIEAKRLGDERHHLIHGLLHFVNLSEQRWRTQRVVYDGALARLQHKTYTNADLQDIARAISDFSHDLAPKVWVIIGGNPSIAPNYDLEKARRELGMS